MLAIPTLKFSYGNLLLARLRELGSANTEELLGDDPAQIFKSDGPFENPERRARDCLRFARMVDLVVEEERRWELTESGMTYAEILIRAILGLLMRSRLASSVTGYLVAALS